MKMNDDRLREMAEINNLDGYEKIDLYNYKNVDKLAGYYENILELIGEDPKREGLQKTPERVAKSIQFLTHGYLLDPVEILNSAKFQEDYREMVIVKDIEIYSMCEHHMIPFIGKAHVGYIPNGYITGLSKIARVVEAFSRRLQVQERLTSQIKECINDTLKPLGVAVVIEAQHLCMMMRGVQKQNSVTTTSDFTGAFRKVETREEFIHLIGTTLH
jgi:GTP cyclohydrolase I